MRAGTICLLGILLFSKTTAGQQQTITGKVVNPSLLPVHQLIIYTTDTTPVVLTDTGGRFKIRVPVGTHSILVTAIGMESKKIDLARSCKDLEVVLFYSYQFSPKTAAKVDRLRKQEFDKLPELHRSAFEKGIFKQPKPCYPDQFISIAPGQPVKKTT